MKFFKDANGNIYSYEDDIKKDLLNSFIKKLGLSPIDENEAEKFNGSSFDRLETSKLFDINTSCETAIVSGFPSSALRSEHFYQSDRDDQINLMGLVTAAKDDLLKCGVKDSDGNITWEWKPHTKEQLKEVFDDGAAYKKEQLIKSATLKVQINAATTVEELDGINW